MIRAGPDGRVDHALLFGLELDGHARYLLGGVRSRLHPDVTTAARFRATVRTDLSDSDKSGTRVLLESGTYRGYFVRVGPIQNLLRGRATHADAVRNADSLVRVARYVQAGNLRAARFKFDLAGGMSDRVLRHGARRAGNAREAGGRGHAGNLAQFLGHRRGHRFVALRQHARVD